MFPESSIKNIFQHYTPKPYGTKPPSAVLVPLMEIDGKINVLFTQRALHMVYQPGDFCFPGGHHENDESPEETAIRETYEELGIKRENIEIIGRPDYMLTKYDAYVIPFIGFVKNTSLSDLVLNKDEVEKVLSVPLEYFLETTPKTSSMKFNREFASDFPFEMLYGGKNYKFPQMKEEHFFYDYKGNYIWGLTAKIIKNVSDILKQNDK